MESNDSFLISVIKIFIALIVICYIFMNKKCKENFANDTSSRKDDFSDNFKSKEKKIINDLIGEFKVTYTKKSNFQILIKAFKEFEEIYGDQFLEMITKEKLQNDENVQKIIRRIIEEEKGFIFEDLLDKKVKKIVLEDEKLKIIS